MVTVGSRVSCPWISEVDDVKAEVVEHGPDDSTLEKSLARAWQCLKTWSISCH